MRVRIGHHYERHGGARSTPALPRRLPARGRERAEIVLIGHSRHSREHDAQVGERVCAVALAGNDDRVDDRGALAGVGVTDEQPVFLADGRGADGIFDEVVVEGQKKGSGFVVCGCSGRGAP